MNKGLLLYSIGTLMIIGVMRMLFPAYAAYLATFTFREYLISAIIPILIYILVLIQFVAGDGFALMNALTDHFAFVSDKLVGRTIPICRTCNMNQHAKSPFEPLRDVKN